MFVLFPFSNFSGICIKLRFDVVKIDYDALITLQAADPNKNRNQIIKK